MTSHVIDSSVLYRCDCCGDVVWLHPDAALPLPWRDFTKSGWVGKFVACSDRCEQNYLDDACPPLPEPDPAVDSTK